MPTFISLFVLLVTAVAGASTQAPTLEMLRAQAQERMRQDAAIYPPAQRATLEELYQRANRDLRSPDAKDILQRVVKEYPKSNRAGSATLYLAQLTTGDERENYLKIAVKDHNDSWYGDGVQVGAFARAQLAVYYSSHDRAAEARTLAAEVVDRFPGAVDHGGRPLADMLRKLKLVE